MRTLLKVPVLKEVFYLYTLTDPRTSEVCYVGRSDDPEARLKEHIRSARSKTMGNAFLRRWLLDLDHEGLSPDLDYGYPCYGLEKAKREERRLIRQFRKMNPELLNLEHNPNRVQRRHFTKPYLRRVGAA